jgi:hypothetical protein
MVFVIVRYMSKIQLRVEIFKPERGSLYTLGWNVLELPLFSTELKWIPIEDVVSDYVLDIRVEVGISLTKCALDFMNECNRAWNKCIENNMDFYSFIYEYD